VRESLKTVGKNAPGQAATVNDEEDMIDFVSKSAPAHAPLLTWRWPEPRNSKSPITIASPRAPMLKPRAHEHWVENPLPEKSTAKGKKVRLVSPRTC
jgi:hypothetical protein